MTSMPPLDRIDEYVGAVCRQIRNKDAHSRVSEELRSHIADMRDDYISRGFNEQEALEKAIAQTGEAMTVGEQFDKIHLPEPKWGMRPSLTMKTMLRAPVRTLLTFLLIAAASFALFSRVADYAVTQREMKRVTSYYRGVSAFDTGVPNTAMLLASFLPNSAEYSYNKEDKQPLKTLTQEQMSAFSSLPGVSGTDIRYMTAGVIDELERVVRYEPYIASYDYTDRFVVEGTLESVSPVTWGRSEVNLLNLTDCVQLAGGLPMMQGDNLSVISFNRNGGVGLTHGDMRMFLFLADNPYDQSFAESLTAGDRCLIIGRWDPRYYVNENIITEDDRIITELFIGDQDTLDYCDSFRLLNGKPENWLETGEFAGVRLIVDITDRDLKTFDIVYTSDLLAVPRFNEKKMIIQEGRAITPEDSGEVCVVNYAFAEINGLKIGDKITVGLCDKLLHQHMGMGATAVIPERYGETVSTAELEIVGIYADVDPSYERDASLWWCYSPNTIFVPSALLPVEVPDDYGIAPGEFSVVIDDAFMMQSFLDEAKPLVKEMGLRGLRFSDGGWLAAADNLSVSRSMSLLTTIMFIGAAAVAILLGVYMYIMFEKKNFAVMRALGTPQKKARNTLLLPLIMISAAAVTAGGITGMFYAHGAITAAVNDLAAAVTSEYIPDTSLPAGIMLLCLLGETLFLVVITALFLRKLVKTPPLDLLQGNVIRVKIRKGYAEFPDGEIVPVLEPFTLPQMPKRGGYGPVKHVSRYIVMHMRRARIKTALAVVLAALLTGACGLLAVTKLSYEELFDQTNVKGILTNFTSDAITEASKSEWMNEFFYGGGYTVMCDGEFENTGYFLAVTNDFDRYVSTKSEYEYDVWYGDGYGPSMFSQEDNGSRLIVIGNALAAMLGAMPGDGVTLLSWERAYASSAVFDEELFESEIKRNQIEFTVAGIVTSDDYNIALGIFAPISNPVERISAYGEFPFSVEYAEFMLADKENPQPLMGYLEELSKKEHYYSEVTAYHMDLAEIDNIRHVRDMLRMLFPLAVAAAAAIGLAAPLLIIMQSSKEAAIMRILGTGKGRSRCMLAIEQISLCVFGLAIAATALAIYNTGLFVRSADTLMLCGGIYLIGCMGTAVFAASMVTRRKVLELLQVKE